MKLRLLILLGLFPALVQTQTLSTPTVAEAEQFMKQVEIQLNDIKLREVRATWIQENFITDDTEALAADASDRATAVVTELIEKSRRFEGLLMPADLARKFMLLKLAPTAPAPHDAVLRKEMTTVVTSLNADYGKGKCCRKPDDCLDITAIEKIWVRAAIPRS